MDVHSTTRKVQNLTGTKKKTFWISVNDGEIGTASYWSGGSIRYYSVLNLKTLERKTPSAGTFPMFIADYKLEKDEILISTGVSSGKDATAHFYCKEEDLETLKRFLDVIN